MLQKQFCTVLVLQKHVSESVLCKTELVYTQKKQTGQMGSCILVQARRAGLHMKISHSSEGDARFCKQSKKDNKTEIRESEGWGQNEVKTYEIA